MYDEVTRQQDHYWASYMYAQEEGCAVDHADGMVAGRAEGMATGLAEGRAEGMMLGLKQAVITLMKNGHISPEVAAAQLKINIDELGKHL